jgi:hypothetical protein
MKKQNLYALIIGSFSFLFIYTKAIAEKNDLPIKNTKVFKQANSYKDYVHATPLFDALHCGFTIIEQDIFILYKNPTTGKLVDNKLSVFNNSQQKKLSSYVIMVGQTSEKYKGTFYDLYLKPLKQLKSKQFVFSGYNKPIFYMINVKTNHPGSIEFMNLYLSQYKNIINNYNSMKSDKPISVILTGYTSKNFYHEDFDYLLSTENRYINMEGKMENPLIGQKATPDLFPLISTSWDNMTNNKLHNAIKEAHTNGYKIRFCGSRENKRIWKEMKSAGADIISTYNLKKLKNFLNTENNSIL